MKQTKLFIGIAMLGLALTSCSVVRPGEIGFRQTVGKLRGEVVTGGMAWYNPFITKFVKMNCRTMELFDKLPLPTQEGLSVVAELTLLYHIQADSAKSIYAKLGSNYEEKVVQSNFWATAREISARFSAKELYATERVKFENSIMEELKKHISKYGFVVDAVLLKDIDLPQQMQDAIQAKVNAEQAVLQMEFVIQKQQKEAERIVIEAEGIKKAQDIINSSLNENQLRYNQIQMLKELTNSPNTKIIITDDGSSGNVILSPDK